MAFQGKVTNVVVQAGQGNDEVATKLRKQSKSQCARMIHYLVTAQVHVLTMATSTQLKGNVHPDSMDLTRFHTDHGNL